MEWSTRESIYMNLWCFFSRGLEMKWNKIKCLWLRTIPKIYLFDRFKPWLLESFFFCFLFFFSKIRMIARPVVPLSFISIEIQSYRDQRNIGAEYAAWLLLLSAPNLVRLILSYLNSAIMFQTHLLFIATTLALLSMLQSCISFSHETFNI